MNSGKAQSWEETLRVQALHALRGNASPVTSPWPDGPPLVLISRNRTVADGQTAYLMGQSHVLLVSAAQFPDASAMEVEKMRDMQECLGSHAGRVLLDVVGHGRADGRSFLIVPRCKPLPNGRVLRRLACWQVRARVLQWLRDVAVLVRAPDADARQQFLESLAALHAMQGMPDAIRRAARQHMDQLESGQTQARHVPMHGDLWAGNLMYRPDGRLAVIDWGGSVVRGYGIYDLIRVASSLRLPLRLLARELAWHVQTLGDVQHGAQLHLLAALGYYARNLGELPEHRFASLAQRCWAELNAVQNRLPPPC